MELLIIFVFNLINGIFALSEIALVSVRKQRINQLAEEGDSRAFTVLELLKNPENFLSAVQIGITLISIISGVYGGATLTDNFKPVVEQVEILRPYAGEIAYVLVVGLITYMSIVIGELIPKTLAMKYAEPVALNIGGFIRLFSKISKPFVWLLTTSTHLVFKLFGVKPVEEEKITEEELRHFIKTAGRQGVLDKDESEIHHNVLTFSDLRSKSIMTHRLHVEWLDITDPLETIDQQIRKSNHTHFPVCEDGYDHILGFLQAKDYYEKRQEKNFTLGSVLREPVIIPENMYAIDILHEFKKRRCYFGIVVDEFGAFEGIITLHDLSEALVGDLPDSDTEAAEISTRTDGSLLVSGSVLVSDLNHFLDTDLIPEKSAYYNTLAGFVMHHLERIPNVGELFDFNHRQFEILDKDGARIDKVLIREAVEPE
ncbi:MAG: HlyC/CorC family transporter [Saprospiraceae bacterium]|nr:HlyC/CorC family transporter [Saprospiraceae bacterium]